MAADQQKKRLNAVRIIDYTSRNQQKVKRRKLVSPQPGSSIRPNITLQWDDKRKGVIAKKEQISIARRDLTPSNDAVPNHNVLADIIDVPGEIFELENLVEVLTCEVWQTHLSKKERNLLTQFLPEGVEVQKVVQELLEGDNFHFGNPFLKWGASLCSGSLHPDTVLRKEQFFKANKKAYYSELQKYHHGMIGDLQMWKERWASCKDPEKEIVQTLWRSRKNAEKSIAIHGNESRLHGPDDSIVVTSESCSSAGDDKAFSSDDLNFMSMHENSQRKGFMEGKYDNSLDEAKVVERLRKGERLHKRNVQISDGAKYMSYIKVSKEQHQRVKSSMKHSSSSIRPKSLNFVLGDLDTYCVKPYKLFEEEEHQKLHEHWLQLANRDLPAGFANWRRRQLDKWKVTQVLGKELEEKMNCLKEDDVKESPNVMVGGQMDGALYLEPTIIVEDEEKEISDNLLQERMDSAAPNQESAIGLEDGEIERPGFISQQQSDNSDGPVMEDENECVPVSTQNQHLQCTLLNGNLEFHAMDLDTEDNCVIAKTVAFPPNISEYSENLNHMNVHLSQGNPLSSACDVWPSGSIPSDYYHSNPVSHDYMSPNELSVRHPQVMEEQPAQLINPEPDMQKEVLVIDLLQRQSGDSFFGSYPNQAGNELFQSFFKGQGSLAYHHEQKLTGLDFQPQASVMAENGQFAGRIREQLRPSTPMDPRQKRTNDLYMHHNIRDNMYSDGVRYPIPRQDQFSTLNMQDWAANAVNMSGPLQSHLNGGQFLNQNWYSGENSRARSGWPGSESAVCSNQRIGSGVNADQSLFSVQSQCNDLRPGPGALYDSMGSHGVFNQIGNYNGVGGLPITSNVLPRIANPLHYLSGHEAADSLKINNMGWMSLPHQNAALNDSMAKPSLRSWNQ